MPKADALFLLAHYESDQSDCTGLITSGANYFAPTPCDIVLVTFSGAVITTTDSATVTIYPISTNASFVCHFVY